MKRIVFILLFGCLVLLLSACGNNDDDAGQGATDEAETEEKDKEADGNGNVNVDKGLMNVEVTLPASMFEGQDFETIKAEAEGEGIKEVTQNEDGSITYKMSKAKHEEMMDEIRTSITQSVDEMKNSEEYASIKDVKYNDSFTEFTLVVDQAAYEESMDGFAVFSLGMFGMLYQVYDGQKPDDTSVNIFVQDEASGEVFDEILYPDDFEGEAETEQ
ncbi:hypothetical protein GCM10008967_32670 [Bacillus carboniphilus]|uniref:Antigen I/II N-terminal domain-containing protein n=1 Tax=Bacillus carboniphilus TaxID=86663 RepID=A0ABP3GAG0_9BACI